MVQKGAKKVGGVFFSKEMAERMALQTVSPAKRPRTTEAEAARSPLAAPPSTKKPKAAPLASAGTGAADKAVAALTKSVTQQLKAAGKAAAASVGAAAPAKNRTPRRRSTWLVALWRWRPRGAFSLLCFAVVALCVSGHGGCLSQLARLLGTTNAGLAIVVGGVANATQGMLQATGEVARMGRDMLTTSGSLVHTMWGGVDLANVTAERKYGRVLAQDRDAMTQWFNDMPTDHVPFRAKSSFVSQSLRVSYRVPYVETSDEFLDVAGGAYWSWLMRCRHGDSGAVGCTFAVTIIRYEPTWAFVGWEALELPLTKANLQILPALHEVQRELEPLNLAALDIPDHWLNGAYFQLKRIIKWVFTGMAIAITAFFMKHLLFAAAHDDDMEDDGVDPFATRLPFSGDCDHSWVDAGESPAHFSLGTAFSNVGFSEHYVEAGNFNGSLLTGDT